MTRSEKTLIFSVTVGNILEWYEFTLFAFLSPILSSHYFHNETPAKALLYTFMIYAAGFLSRPIGGLFFGYLGDRYGRKFALLFSVIAMTVPTFCIGLIPTTTNLGLTAPLLLLILRLLQGLITGGELAGIMCFLNEGVPLHRRTFISSWSFIGVQLGGIFSLIECLFLSRTLTFDAFIAWGWRISFVIGGIVGLIGLFLRYRLKETPLFHQLEKNHKLIRTPILETFSRYKKHLLSAFLITGLPLSANFLLFSFSSIYFKKVLFLPFESSIIYTGLLILLSTIFLPIFGKLGSIFPRKRLLLIATLGLILIAYPLLLAVRHNTFVFPLAILCILFLTCYLALIPSTLVELFPTTIRYTSLGFSYNCAATILGGTTPLIALTLLNTTQNITAPSLIVIVTGLLSLFALLTAENKSIFH